ncbi:TNT domain-containing protein [Saccharothrix deserti]|uniref:TNT domain-containing protein n=1 Tax=Saccharothrix deserti TaxID=2593674 RepID=UPI00192E5ABC|nr:TNT domain-containing protein [Saccharothrix deserti]
MSLRKSLITYLIALPVVLGLVAPAAHAAPASARGDELACIGPFYQDDTRLGPKDLPAPHDPVGKMLVGYERFGKLNSKEFLGKYWEDHGERIGWKYPPNDGFQGEPKLEDLRVGAYVDRFGGESGRFLAPVDTSFAKRSIPPQSLDSCYYKDGFRKNSYYKYVVKKKFKVLSGTTAAAFEQPGGGVQYKVIAPPGSQERWNVDWLLKHDYLTRV